MSSSYPGGSVSPEYGSSSYGSSGYDSGEYAGGGATAANQPPDVEDESVGTLVGRMTTHLSELMRQEIALAKVELQAEAQKAAKGAGMLAGAGFAAWMVAIFASFTLVWLLDKPMDRWLATLIVTLLWGIAAAALFVSGRKQLKQVNPKPEQTVESLKEDKEWLKAQKN